MATDTIKVVNACKATWAAAIGRTGLQKDEKKLLAVGLSWGGAEGEKAIELYVFPEFDPMWSMLIVL